MLMRITSTEYLMAGRSVCASFLISIDWFTGCRNVSNFPLAICYDCKYFYILLMYFSKLGDYFHFFKTNFL